MVCATGTRAEAATEHVSPELSQRRRRSNGAVHKSKFHKLERRYQPPHLPLWERGCRCEAVERRCGCINNGEGAGCCGCQEQSADESHLWCKQPDMPQSKIKSHVQHRPGVGLPWNTCHPQYLAVPQRIFETGRRKAYQTRAAGQATPREPCPSYS